MNIQFYHLLFKKKQDENSQTDGRQVENGSFFYMRFQIIFFSTFTGQIYTKVSENVLNYLNFHKVLTFGRKNT